MDARLIVAREALIDEVDLAADGSFAVYGRRTTNAAGTANLRRRFAAAVSECGVASNVSAFGQSDCGATYNHAAGLGETVTPEGGELLWRQSPICHVADIHTPLLLLQGEADLRCPTSDTEQLFVALRWLGREVSYVLYPEGDHVYHRVGRPDRRAHRHGRLVSWFERHMPA